MPGPVEEKPFVGKVHAKDCGGGWRLYDSANQQVAVILAEADRAEEIVRLINASVGGRQASVIDRRHGGPAFPGAYLAYPKDGLSEGVAIFEGGMSQRAWFMGHFLAGSAASSANAGPLGVSVDAPQFEIDAALREHWSSVAGAARIAADAFIAEARRP